MGVSKKTLCSISPLNGNFCQCRTLLKLTAEILLYFTQVHLVEGIEEGNRQTTQISGRSTDIENMAAFKASSPKETILQIWDRQESSYTPGKCCTSCTHPNQHLLQRHLPWKFLLSIQLFSLYPFKGTLYQCNMYSRTTEKPKPKMKQRLGITHTR